MNNQEFARLLLCEATELLNEAAAAKEAKAISKNMRSIKKEARVKLFLKGQLNRDEAKELYNSLISQLNDVEEKINNLPKETKMEVVTGYIKSQFTGEGLLSYFAANTITAPGGILAEFFGEMIVYDKLRKTKDGENNWNKARVEKMLASLRKKIDTTYNKYYNVKAQNESIAVLLTEAALLLNDKD